MFHNISQPLWINDGKKTMENRFNNPWRSHGKPTEATWFATSIFFASPGIDLHQVPSVPLPLWPREARVYVKGKRRQPVVCGHWAVMRPNHPQSMNL
jgi:hypothetical protein